MKKLMFTIVFLFYLLAMSAHAVKVTGLYQTELPVSSQSDDERALAVRQGFLQLLIKLTGNPEIEKSPAIKEAIKRADYYVQEYSYSAPTMAASTYFIHIIYETTDVNRLLRKAGIAFWGQKRPLILVWLAVSDLKGAPVVIGNETPGEVLEAMQHQSRRFGLPLIFPIMDVADMSQVSPEEVRAMTLLPLQEAGKRYSPNVYLIGKIETMTGGYQSQWQLIWNKHQWRWSIADKTTDKVIAEVLYQASQALSQHFKAQS